MGTIRNSRIAIAALFLSSCVAFISVPCFAILALAAVFPLRTFRMEQLLSLLGWAVGAQASGALGLSLWRKSLVLMRSTIRSASDGVYFRFDSLSTQPEDFIAWKDIRGIRYQRTGRVQSCSVVGPGDRIVQFSAHTFLRPKAVARRLAGWTGIPVTEK